MKRKFIWLFLTVTALLAASNFALAASWNTAQGNFQRTGLATQPLDQARLTNVWSFFHGDYSLWSAPTEHNGVVYFTTNGAVLGVPSLWAVDLNTGGFLWSAPNPGARTAPTVVTVDTGGGFFADLVLVPSGGGGGAASIRCFYGGPAGGAMRWEAFTGAIGVRYSRLAVADTNLDGTLDIVITGSDGGSGGQALAYDLLTGAPAWGPIVLDLGWYIFFSPSLSADHEIAYFGTYDLLGGGGGNAYALSTDDGSIVGSFNSLTDAGVAYDEGIVAAPVYIDDSTVLVLGYGPGGYMYVCDRTLNFLGRSGANAGYVFNNGAFYVDPIGPDSLYWLASETFEAAIARYVPGARVTGPSLVSIMGTNGGSESPIVIGGNGTAEINTNATSGLDNGMTIFDANETNPGFPYWFKPLWDANALGIQSSGAAIVDESEPYNTDDIVLLVQEDLGSVHAFAHSLDPRPRWQHTLDGTTPAGFTPEVLLNVPILGSGTDTDTFTLLNVGDGPGGIYGVAEVGDSAFAASLANRNLKNLEIRYRETSPQREALAARISDDLTVTVKNKLLPKSLTTDRKAILADEYPELLSGKASYLTMRKDMAKTASAPNNWLSSVNLSGGGPFAPGGTVDIELTADASGLPFGQYFADVLVTVAPDEPDAQLPNLFWGNPTTDIVTPVRFVVGYIPDFTWVEASDAALAISNVGFFGHAQGEDLFYWNGNNPAQLFAGGLVIVGTDFVWDASYDDHGDFIPDQVTDCNFTGALSPYVADAHICSTAFVATSATCTLRVVQYYVGLWDGAFCDSMIIQKNVIYNTGSLPCTFGVGYFTDWDFPPSDYSSDTVGADPVHQIGFIQNVNTPDQIIGVMRKPADDDKAFIVGIDNPTSIYNTTDPVVDDTLVKWWNTAAGTFDMYGAPNAPDDKSIAIGHPYGIVLNPGESHLDEYIIFGWDNTDVPFGPTVWKAWLRQEGFYRGDVNTDNRGNERDINNNDLGPAPNGGGINVVDVVFLANYVLKATASPWPFTDQGDVNCDGNVTLTDVVALANYIFKGTNIPVDKNRFLPADLQSLFSRSSLQENPDYK